MIGAPVRRERWYGQIAPMATVLGAILLDLLWIPVPGFNAIAPAFAVMAVYCWAVWRPSLLPYIGVFAAGLFEDLVRGTPLGTGSLALLAVQGFVWAQQRLLRTRSFDVLWLGFAVTAFIGAVATWCAVSIAYRMPMSPWPGAMQFLLTVAAFPPMAFILLRIERTLARPA
ncbi:MAG: rod shape-determining protein MreD [Rhodospirillaceae bacterium]|nr:rod shape-determining protein MreD [Rhodospirillaceae bacterium]